MLLASLVACEEPAPDGPRVLAGTEHLLLVAPAAERTLSRFRVGAQITEILPVYPDEVWLATWAGLTHVPAPLGDVGTTSTTDSLGTLDGIERDPDTGLLYLLQHPGDDPTEVTEPHVVIEWNPEERSAVRTWTVDLLSYDLHLDPDRGVLVTPLSGRRLWWISFARNEAWPIDLPPAPGRPPQGRTAGSVDGGVPYVRVGAVLRETGRVVVVEQGLPDRNRVWILDPEGDEIDGFDLPRSAHYQGGALAPDGRTLVLNAIEAVEVVDLVERVETGWIALDAPHFRIAIEPSGRLCYLTAPGDTEAGGRITTIDLVEQRVLRQFSLPLRADAVAAWAP